MTTLTDIPSYALPDSEMLRLPPHSIEAEQSVLGALMTENEALDRISDVLKESDFYRGDHRMIYARIVKMIDAGKTADVITVFEEFQQLGNAEEVGGLQYLNAMAQSAPSTANIRRYAEIVHDRAQLRAVITVAAQVASEAYSTQGKDTAAIIDSAQGRFMDLTAHSDRREPLHIADVLGRVVQDIDTIYHSDSGVNEKLISTGIPNLDRAFGGGYDRGCVYVIGGRPGHGKSALSLYSALKVSKTHSVLYLQLEMTCAQMTKRALAAVGEISKDDLAKPKNLDANDGWPRITRACQAMSAMKFYMDDEPSLNLQAIARKARGIKRKHGLDLLVLDHLGLTQPVSKGHRRDLELSEVSNGLKRLAKELDCPVVVLTQLNRSIEGRPNKRPQMSDIRECGALEEDADYVLFLYREFVYTHDPEFYTYIEGIIGKARDAEPIDLHFYFNPKMQRFDEAVGQPIRTRRQASESKGFE